MNLDTREQKKNAAIEAVLAKISPDDPARKTMIRELAKGDEEHEQTAIYELLRVLANFPA